MITVKIYFDFKYLLEWEIKESFDHFFFLAVLFWDFSVKAALV